MSGQKLVSFEEAFDWSTTRTESLVEMMKTLFCDEKAQALIMPISGDWEEKIRSAIEDGYMCGAQAMVYAMRARGDVVDAGEVD